MPNVFSSTLIVSGPRAKLKDFITEARKLLEETSYNEDLKFEPISSEFEITIRYTTPHSPTTDLVVIMSEKHPDLFFEAFYFGELNEDGWLWARNGEVLRHEFSRIPRMGAENFDFGLCRSPKSRNLTPDSLGTVSGITHMVWPKGVPVPTEQEKLFQINDNNNEEVNKNELN